MVVKGRSSFQLPLNIQQLAVITVSLPLLAFAFCVTYSFLYNFENSTYTHCEVYNFAPSISAAIGSFVPQKYVWQSAIALHTAPRFLFEVLYNQLFYQRLNYLTTATRRLVKAAFWFSAVEIFALLGLSVVSSQEEFEVHKICFSIFVLTFFIYMCISYYLFSRCGFKPQTGSELTSLYLKKIILSANFLIIPLMCLFYYRHNEYCEPYVYSFFCMCEYAIVVLNMVFHFTAYLDFQDVTLLVPSKAQIVYSAMKEVA